MFCIIMFTLEKIQLLAAQPRLDCTGSASQGRGKMLKEKKKSGGRGNELFESSCFDFPALYSAASPVIITFNITMIFIIYFVLMSSGPNLKQATF